MKQSTTRDRGSVLPFTLVFMTVTAFIVLGLSSYVITNLRYGAVTENRSDRLSAADAGMRYAIDQLKLRNAGCILDTQEAVLPGVEADFNGASASVTCERITSGFEGIQAYAAVMTGEGLGPSDHLLSSQAGAGAEIPKVLGGPVYMSRIDAEAFELSPDVYIEDGPLLYRDTSGASPCASVKSSTMDPKLVFEPELIFGPVCVSVSWEELFDSPEVPDLTDLPIRDGSDFTDDDGCQVFEPGRYTTPPATSGTGQVVDSYFRTGDYVMDFDGSWEIGKGLVTAGVPNPLTTLANELQVSDACMGAQAADSAALAADPAAADETGATIYLAGGARIAIIGSGALEIHARQQGLADYVSIQTLCDPTLTWCNASGSGYLDPSVVSTESAPAPSGEGIIFTASGNKKEFVAHALVYAPLAQVEFGNVTSTSEQKMKGGLIVSRLVLQSSASATNFEISVPTSPITAEIRLTSRAVKDGTTSVQAIVEYRPYEALIEDRVRVNSSRVCSTADCSVSSSSTPTCTGGDAVWSNSFWSNSTLTGSPDFTSTSSDVNFDIDWGSGSPDGSINPEDFSARFTRTVDLPEPGTYRFTVGSDDGQRLYVNGALELNDWETQNYVNGVNTVDVTIADRCSVDIELEYNEVGGQARVSLSWIKL